MFSYCVDPKTIEGFMWLSCYVTTAKHMSFYFSFLVVMGLLSLAAPLAMAFGFAGATASRSSFKIIRSVGKGYLAMIRGIPDIVFFLFIPIALDQAFEYLRPSVSASSWVVCSGSSVVRSTIFYPHCDRCLPNPSMAAFTRYLLARYRQKALAHWVATTSVSYR